MIPTIMNLMKLIFVISACVTMVNGGTVEYTFNKDATAVNNIDKDAENSYTTTIEAENPYIKITTTAKAYDKINDLIAESGKTLLVVDVILEDHGYSNLLIAPGDFSVKINNGTIYHHGIAWHNLKSIGKHYLTNELDPSGSTQINQNGEVYLRQGDIRKGSLLFEGAPLDIESYDFMWVLANSFNTTIDEVHFGKGEASKI